MFPAINMCMPELPSDFLSRINEIIPQKYLPRVVESFSEARNISMRINTLRISAQQGFKFLDDQQIKYKNISWLDRAFILETTAQKDINEWEYIKSGCFYQQRISSMLAAKILNPKEGDQVLDLCAAPGSKTSLMADLMNNKGTIIANEHVRERMYKLKSVLSLLGVLNTKIILNDGRRYKPVNELYDKVLVDAPCSSEGRFHVSQPKSFAYWSNRKIKEMRKKQKGLLLNALRLLKRNGELVYSTCTFSPEENEEVVDWALRKMNDQVKLMEIELDSFVGVLTYPALEGWKERKYNPSIKSCLRILPTKDMDGFFIAKFVRQ